jgi:hypothetical protein
MNANVCMYVCVDVFLAVSLVLVQLRDFVSDLRLLLRVALPYHSIQVARP